MKEQARAAARRLPTPVKGALHRVAGTPAVRRLARPVRWGSLRRTEPVSRRWGRDRGTPVDRAYLAEFFDEQGPRIRGRVLEVGSADFTDAHGTGVSTVDIVDIDPRNDRATILADLADAGCLPVAAFDCCIVPQTLQYVGDVDTAIANLWAAVAPGGSLLVTVPGIAKIDHNARDVDRHRFTPVGVRELLARHCAGGDVEIVEYGNVLAASAFLMGISAGELRPEELAVRDPDYPMLVGAAVRKAAA